MLDLFVIVRGLPVRHFIGERPLAFAVWPDEHAWSSAPAWVASESEGARSSTKDCRGSCQGIPTSAWSRHRAPAGDQYSCIFLPGTESHGAAFLQRIIAPGWTETWPERREPIVVCSGHARPTCLVLEAFRATWLRREITKALILNHLKHVSKEKRLCWVRRPLFMNKPAYFLFDSFASACLNTLTVFCSQWMKHDWDDLDRWTLDFETYVRARSTTCFLPFEAQLAVVACDIRISRMGLCQCKRHQNGVIFFLHEMAIQGYTGKRREIANHYSKAKHRTNAQNQDAYNKTPVWQKQWKQKQQGTKRTALHKNQAKNCLPVSVKKGKTMKNVVPPNCKSSNIPSNATAIGRLSGLCASSWRWPCMAQRDPMAWQTLTTIELAQMMYMMNMMIYIIVLICILAIVSYRMIQHCLFFPSMGKRQTMNVTKHWLKVCNFIVIPSIGSKHTKLSRHRDSSACTKPSLSLKTSLERPGLIAGRQSVLFHQPNFTKGGCMQCSKVWCFCFQSKIRKLTIWTKKCKQISKNIINSKNRLFLLVCFHFLNQLWFQGRAERSLALLSCCLQGSSELGPPKHNEKNPYKIDIRRPRQTQGGARQGIRQASLAAPAARAAAVAVAAAAASPALAVRAAAAANQQQPVAH